MTVEVPDLPGAPAHAPGRGSRGPRLITIALVAVVVTLIGALVATRGDDSIGVGASQGAQQLASIQEACVRWHDGYTGSPAPSSAWCDEMVGWMTARVGSRQMMGSMMWSDPDQMLATCQRWMTSSQPSNGSMPTAATWCSQMVTWMTEHMGNWDRWDRGWMMNGPMMDR